MAYHYFRGDAVDEENPDKKLMSKVIQTIGSCFDYPDDNVQLQIIKAFFTAVTEPICGVHENLLMNAIRTIYNIYLVSRNQVNQNTAKATLTQMLNIIFTRMETKVHFLIS
jgi:brefeldin A-inhibited guanine nucleotide-exchange protein